MAESEKKNSGIKEFFKGLKVEFKKIIWPSRDELVRQTVAVVLVSVLLGVLISALDAAFHLGLNMIIK